MLLACTPSNRAGSKGVTGDDAGHSAQRPEPHAVSGKMVSIPAGSFLMGSLDGVGKANEHPQHRVSVAAFEMDEMEVTVAAYGACVKNGQCTPSATTVDWPGMPEAARNAYGPFCNGDRPDRQNHPVNCIDWKQATAYCAWAGKRLPTEEEWEYAARGGDGRTYPWGEAPPSAELCWSGEHRRDGTCSVGGFPSGQSPFGLQDMMGNISEWTSSGYSKDYNQTRGDTGRSLRGGSWYESRADSVRTAFRDWFPPSARNSDLGVRCAR
jgi:formylglycine-generating enzyme required for sulfatase activity